MMMHQWFISTSSSAAAIETPEMFDGLRRRKQHGPLSHRQLNKAKWMMTKQNKHGGSRKKYHSKKNDKATGKRTRRGGRGRARRRGQHIDAGHDSKCDGYPWWYAHMAQSGLIPEGVVPNKEDGYPVILPSRQAVYILPTAVNPHRAATYVPYVTDDDDTTSQISESSSSHWQSHEASELAAVDDSVTDIIALARARSMNIQTRDIVTDSEEDEKNVKPPLIVTDSEEDEENVKPQLTVSFSFLDADDGGDDTDDAVSVVSSSVSSEDDDSCV